MKRLGIDFGSSYIKCSDAEKEDLIPLDKKPQGGSDYRIPNIITYYSNGNVRLGKVNYLKKKEESDTSVVIDKIKLSLADSGWSRRVTEDRTVKASDVTNDIMQSLYNMLHEKNKNENEYRATITVPVCFSERQREIVRRAAEKAGFIVESIITEPAASLFYLMRDELEADHNVLVIDIGGGTTDICLAKIVHRGETCEIIFESSLGMNFGGITINNAIIDKILLPRYKDKLEPILINEKEKNIAEWNRAKLFYDVDEIKGEIFTEDCDEEDNEEEHEIIYSSYNDNFDLSISAADIYQMFDDMKLRETICSLIEEVIDDSTMTCDEITDVFLTGGTSLIPYFKKVVVEYLQDNGIDDAEPLFELYEGLEIDEQAVGAVALGAGIYNELMADSDENMIINDKIPFVVFSYDEKGNTVTKLTADCMYKDYRSMSCSINRSAGKDRIELYQKLPGAMGDTVYIGYISIDEDIRNTCTLYRLGIDNDRRIFAEFGINEGSRDDAQFVPQFPKRYLEIED